MYESGGNGNASTDFTQTLSANQFIICEIQSSN